VDFEEIGVIDWNVNALFKYIFLDAVIVESYVLNVVHIGYINQEFASFHNAHRIPNIFEIVALENPLEHSKKSKYLGNLFTPLQSFLHFLDILLMLFPHQWRNGLIDFNRNIALEPH
jgi:hypothetical protein